MTRTAGALAILLAACASETGTPAGGTNAMSCGTCHETQHDAWSRSPHATSGASPVFTAMLPAVERAWGSAARDRCVACHEPGHGGDAGIGCVTCHAAVGNTAERDGLLRVELASPIAGPFDDPVATPAHATRAGGFLASSSLCGTCHEVRGPELFDEPTLGEHRASSFGAVGTGCATCHMPFVEDGEAARETGVSRYRRSHGLGGVDPDWNGEDADGRARVVALLASAVELAVERSDEGRAVEVVLTNVGAGHAVPTGAAFLRDLYVDVAFFDATGTPAGEAPRAVELGSRMTREDVEVASITDADRVETRSLGPDETRRTHVEAPPGAVRAVATLRFRAVRHETLHALGLDALVERVPTLDIATGAVEL